jgi:Lamin Tail Domain/Immunoglobulin I-set domain
MNKKNLAVCLVGFAVIFQTHAQLAITEVMSGETDKNHPDWFELHNYGSSSINLTGYSWNDDSHGGLSGADSAPFTDVSIAAGETIIVTEQKSPVVDAATFRTWWSISSSIQVVVLTSTDPGLGASPIVAGTRRADSVRLWSTNLVALGANTNGLDLDGCADYLVQRVDLGVTTNKSLLYNPASGVYDIQSTSGVGGAHASATVVTDIGSPGIAPSSVAATITQTPVAKTVTVGDSVTFTNGGIALPPLIFRWYFNDTPITSQTPGVAIFHIDDTSILTLTDVHTTNAGTYKVIAANGLESFTNTAVLTVNATPTAPFIVSVTPALNSFDAYLGQTPTLSVLASGYPSPTYQWFKYNTPISSETNANFTLALSDTNQTGVYSVIVTNAAGGTNVSFTINVSPVPNLVITEVMSGESADNSNGDTSGHGDWFELSNLGDFPVNLSGYRIDDNSHSLSQSTTVTGPATIHPGESVVFVLAMTPQAFRDWWGPNLPASVQVISYNGSGLGLSGTGDDVHIWNAVASGDADQYQIAHVSFLTGTDGVSFGFDPTITDETGFYGFAPDGLSINGVNGAFVATVGGDIGSPGTIVNLPRITGITKTNGGFQLSWVNQPNWNYTVEYKTNLTDFAWTTLTNLTSDSSSAFSIIDPTITNQRFYRIGLIP